MRGHVVRLLLVAMLLMGCAALANAAVVSTFDTDDEGWLSLDTFNGGAGGLYSVTYQASGGNPGGCIFANDVASGYQVFAAPANFLGDISGYLGGSLSWDLVHTSSGTVVPSPGAFLLGDGLVLCSDPLTPPQGGWVSYQVALEPGSWFVNSDPYHSDFTYATHPTDAQFKGILQNLTGMYLDFDYATGDDAASLDNVSLQSVPEPGSLFALAAGLTCLLSFARRRK